ncbi:MAG: hypothetical protein Q3M24_22545 [Candidatus Electrothrix aestuarii]|uniref:Uncharacterized protein n=1 Tax=Candidatus Electrothrix aestuarii TaxID=3062594 RepID=A0AAU8LVX6_9BACT|nr:hypothetical protein [Candidatus Electrothrix aestuarii]
MKFSISNFFSRGHFWTNLEATLKAIRSELDSHSQAIYLSKERDVKLIEYIRHLEKEISHLRKRVETLDKRLYEVNSFRKREDELIVLSDKNRIKISNEQEKKEVQYQGQRE